MDLQPALTDWLPLVAASTARTQELASGGGLHTDVLTSLADLKAVFAHDLRPRPGALVPYLEQARAEMMDQLRHAGQHDAARVVHIRSEDGYDYAMTARKALRRELDHTLDHLNQIEQWIAWQDHGMVPTPTDGWAPSGLMLDDDRLSLTEHELSAWLWRVDISWELLIRRVAQLTTAQIEWQPPDGGWSLRRVIYHTGRGFYAAWLDRALPDEPRARYDEASRRFEEALRRIVEEPLPTDLLLVGREGRVFAPSEPVLAVLAAEHHVQAGLDVAPPLVGIA
jgi:hypothetical protein